jgi:uncharacterized protein
MSEIRDYVLEFTKKKVPVLQERELKVSDTKRRIVSVIGPRRAGKTSFFYKMIEDDRIKNLYVNFEDTRLIDIGFKEIKETVRAHKEIMGNDPECLFFDEVQNIDRWEVALRELLDKNKYRILVTGSSSRLLSREIATSLRGRTLTYLLLPFSFTEYLKARNIPYNSITEDEAPALMEKLDEYLEYGGLPELVFEEEKDRILKEFYEMILFRDIVERHKLRNINLARFLLTWFSQNFSREISINKIFNFFVSQGRKFGKNTLYEYVDKIEDSVALFFLKRYSETVYQREAWPKKIYLCDTGISRVAKFQRDKGMLMENAVFLHLLREKNLNPLAEIYYYVSSVGEVDFVVKQGQKVTKLIQVCMDTNDLITKDREIKSLLKSADILHCSNLSVITWNCERNEKHGKQDIQFVPLWKYLAGGK